MDYPLQVQKRNGKLETYQTVKLRLSFQKVIKDKLNSTEQGLLISKVEKGFFNNISTAQITESLILTAVGFIEKDLVFDIITTQLLLHKVYREAFGRKINWGNFSETYRKT